MISSFPMCMVETDDKERCREWRDRNSVFPSFRFRPFCGIQRLMGAMHASTGQRWPKIVQHCRTLFVSPLGTKLAIGGQRTGLRWTEHHQNTNSDTVQDAVWCVLALDCPAHCNNCVSSATRGLAIILYYWHFCCVPYIV